ncbi:MAG: protein kinase [Planctomycetota bacterium]|nr:protein kinase [Planctomycetota bacterium]
MARLTWKDPDGTSRTVSLPDSAVLGRDPQVDCILQYRGISRRHARIEQSEGRYYVEDLGSTNGTRINGSTIATRIPLESGDRIQLGKLTVEFDDGGRPTDRVEFTEPLSRTLKFERAVAEGDQVAARKLPEILPRRFGKFCLLEKLGQGGMGAVYRALDGESQRELAVKLIRSHIGRRESFLEFFHHREAVLAREIDHPNVIRVFEHGVEDDKHYISMEYVQGDNLYRAMKRRRLQPGEVLETLRQVACGLAAAHRQGVVHSDVKPANILLQGEYGTASEDGEAEELALPDDVGPDGILEFEDSKMGPFEPPAARVDTGLLDEIQRRTSDKSPLAVLEDPPYYVRPSETRFLEHYLERTAEGRGFFLLLEGEPGVGKSRLISEFLLKQSARSPSQQDGQGTRCFELDCSRIEGIPLLYEQMTSRKPGADFNLRHTVEELKRLTEEDTRPTAIRILDVGGASQLAYYLIASWFSLMEKQPLLLIASLDSGEVKSNETIKVLLDSAHAVLKELYLRPLTEYQIQRYLEMLFQESPSDPELGVDLYRLSGGNFARIFDLLRNFFEQGILKVHSSGRLEYRPSPREFELEEGKNLYEKYRALGRLGQRVLESASFIGSKFFFDVVQRFTQVDETALFFVIRQLLADGFLSEEGKTWYSFTNAAFHRYMAEKIPPPDRPHLHRKVSRMLETAMVPESASLLSLRGQHYEGCREHAKAVQCLLEGAHLARNLYEIDQAREMHEEILRIYRQLARTEEPRKEVTSALKEWFRRDGNWYEILGDLGGKPSEASVKIADFGISFRTADEERGYQLGKRPLMGTPRYLAPERGKGESGGPASDLFSLGIIAYEMVVGEPPFPTLSPKEVARVYQHKRLRLPRQHAEPFPDGFAALVDGMLAMDPAARWDADRVLREIVKLQFDLKA